MPRLVLPSVAYKDSFLEALAEYQVEGLANYVLFDSIILRDNFEHFVNQLLMESQGQHLPDGYVPHTTFWLIKDDMYLGKVDVRHELNDYLLRLGGHIGYDIRASQRRQGLGTLALRLALPKARELGLQKVLVTCDETNIGSKKIIEANGGVLEEAVDQGESLPKKLRYWITL